MVLSLAACGTSASNETSAPETSDSAASPAKTPEPGSEPETTESASSAEETESGEETGSTLVVYFSATGNTEQAAQYIADITGGDLFQLEPAEPYTDDDLNYAMRTAESPVNMPTNPCGTWNWWRIPWRTGNSTTPCLSAIPFGGGLPLGLWTALWKPMTSPEKTVIPFCTSASSGLGESGQLLAEMAGTGDWQEGMRFSSSVSEADVQEWIDKLELVLMIRRRCAGSDEGSAVRPCPCGGIRHRSPGHRRHGLFGGRHSKR